jgi:pyrroline-5-carboxylate reductase
MTQEQPTYGIVGVGALASAIVTGLCEVVADPPVIVLSPRNAEASAALAARYPSVSVAADNQAVLDAVDIVIVCLRRAHADLLGDLTWRPEHVVVSSIAGVSRSRLAELVAPAGEVARAVPMPAVATRSSRTPVHPPLPRVLEVFERLGGTMPIEGAEEFEAIFTAMGTVAPFFEYLRILSDFLVGHGLAARDAQQVVAATFTGLLEQLATQESPDFAEMVKEHAPPGGGNEQLTNLMREAGVFEGMARSVEEVHRRLTGSSTGKPGQVSGRLGG